MADDYPRISPDDVLEQLIEKEEEKLGSNITPALYLYLESSTRNIVEERASDALLLLDKLIDKLRGKFYNPISNRRLKPYGQLFASNVLSSIEKYVKRYIHPEDPELKLKVYKLTNGLKYLLKGKVLDNLYETFVTILGKNPYESSREEQERYHKYLLMTILWGNPYERSEERRWRYYEYLPHGYYIEHRFFEKQLSEIREEQRKEQARKYIRRVIMTLMSDPGLGY
jgi:hypothetical protein